MISNQSTPYNYKSTIYPVQVTILAGEQISSIQFCGGMTVLGIATDGNFTPSDITALTSFDEKNFRPLNLCDGQETAVFTMPNLAANNNYGLLVPIFSTYNSFQLVTSVAQTDDTVITVILVPFWQGVHG